MEFSHQGLHCQYASCHQRDFLPFDCKQCSSHFCLAHRTRDQHECPSLKVEEEAARRAPPPAPIALPPKFKCHHRGCKTKEIFSLSCRNCSHNFCLAHRFPTQHACESFAQGVGRNVILPAGIMPPRPLDKHNSSDHSTATIAAPSRTVTTMMAIPAAAASVLAALPLVAVQPAPIAVTCEIPVDSSSASASISTLAAESTTAEITAAIRTPSPLLQLNNGSSCAAEMAQAAANAGSAAATSNSSASSSSSTTSVATKPVITKRSNTNVAHLSKLLKQHS